MRGYREEPSRIFGEVSQWRVKVGCHVNATGRAPKVPRSMLWDANGREPDRALAVDDDNASAIVTAATLQS
jgi:hypothetical protein